MCDSNLSDNDNYNDTTINYTVEVYKGNYFMDRNRSNECLLVKIQQKN